MKNIKIKRVERIEDNMNHEMSIYQRFYQYELLIHFFQSVYLYQNRKC